MSLGVEHTDSCIAYQQILSRLMFFQFLPCKEEKKNVFDINLRADNMFG